MHYLRFIFLFITIVAFTSCATFQKENRRLTNLLDEELTPQDQSTRLWLLPVSAPVGLAAILTDTAVVHPVAMLDDCALDTYRLIWADPQGSMIRQSFLIIPKVIFTPVYFTAEWTWSSLFMGNICEE